MQLTPDDSIIAVLLGFELNATIVNTWIVMIVLVTLSWLVTRNLRPDAPPSRWRGVLELVVLAIEQQVVEVTEKKARHVLYFAGTLFLFIASANILAIIPGFQSPTGSLSTTVALTISVLLAVPLFGMVRFGFGHYFKSLVQPSWFMLPFNLIAEFSKAVSLSIRLYGNVMSGAVIAAILLTIAPFFFPAAMQMLGLLTGFIQAYIFAILALVYISAAITEIPKTEKRK